MEGYSKNNAGATAHEEVLKEQATSDERAMVEVVAPFLKEAEDERIRTINIHNAEQDIIAEKMINEIFGPFINEEEDRRKKLLDAHFRPLEEAIDRQQHRRTRRLVSEQPLVLRNPRNK